MKLRINCIWYSYLSRFNIKNNIYIINIFMMPYMLFTIINLGFVDPSLFTERRQPVNLIKPSPLTRNASTPDLSKV